MKTNIWYVLRTSTGSTATTAKYHKMLRIIILTTPAIRFTFFNFVAKLSNTSGTAATTKIAKHFSFFQQVERSFCLFVCLKLSINIFHHGCVSGWKNLFQEKRYSCFWKAKVRGKHCFDSFQISYNWPFESQYFHALVYRLWIDLGVRGGTFSSQGKIHSNPPLKAVFACTR